MTAPSTPSQSPSLIRWLTGDPGLCGRIALSWALAGGLSMEALLVIAAYLSGTPDAAALPLTATLTFGMGAVGGFVHGVLVGVAGRASNVTLSQALRGVEAGALWALPALVAGWIAAVWISLTSVSLTTGRPWALAMSAAGWLVCAAACAWALAEARLGLRYAMMRWPERRPGAPLVVLTFMVLALAFLWQRPEIWFTDLRVSAVGAVVLALGATFWIALPIEVFLLHVLHQWRADSPIWDPPGSGEVERPG